MENSGSVAATKLTKFWRELGGITFLRLYNRDAYGIIGGTKSQMCV